MTAFAHDVEPTSAKAASDASACLQQALVELREGRAHAARLCCDQALALEPDNPQAHHLCGICLTMLARYGEAVAHLERAVAIDPNVADFHSDLGAAYAQLERYDAAETHFRHALELEPDRIDVAYNVGVLLGVLGRHADAELLFEELLTLDPSSVQVREALARRYLASARVRDAVQLCQEGLALTPDHRGLRHLLGQSYRALGRVPEAREHYRVWLAENPSDEHVRHHYAAYTGDAVPDVASPAYVRDTFDGFAEVFESTLAELEYRAPNLVGSALAAMCGVPQATLRIVDAGCGTGLCAPFLRPYARALVGIDLSGPMLERARDKQLYDEVYEVELVEFLQAHPAAFDAIVSADTLCYFGVLDQFAQAARTSLSDVGVLVFTVEALIDEADDVPWRLQPHGRFCHRRNYVERTLSASRFRITCIEQVVLRTEAQKPVVGWLVTATSAWH